MIRSFVVINNAPPVRANHRDCHRRVRLRAAFNVASAEIATRRGLHNSAAKRFECRFSILTSRDYGTVSPPDRKEPPSGAIGVSKTVV